MQRRLECLSWLLYYLQRLERRRGMVQFERRYTSGNSAVLFVPLHSATENQSSNDCFCSSNQGRSVLCAW